MNYLSSSFGRGKVIDADASGNLQVSELVQGWPSPWCEALKVRWLAMKWQELRLKVPKHPKTHGIRAWSYLSTQIPFFRILRTMRKSHRSRGKRTCVAFGFSGDNVLLGIGLQFWHRSGREAWRSNDQQRTEPPELKDGARCCFATKSSVQLRLVWSQSAASERWIDMAWP